MSDVLFSVDGKTTSESEIDNKLNFESENTQTIIGYTVEEIETLKKGLEEFEKLQESEN